MKNIQLQRFYEKQVKLMEEAETDMDRAELTAMWAGFLNGLFMTRAITEEEYEKFYGTEEMRNAG